MDFILKSYCGNLDKESAKDIKYLIRSTEYGKDISALLPEINLDLMQINKKKLIEYRKKGVCLVATSLDEVKELINDRM